MALEIDCPLPYCYLRYSPRTVMLAIVGDLLPLTVVHNPASSYWQRSSDIDRSRNGILLFITFITFITPLLPSPQSLSTIAYPSTTVHHPVVVLTMLLSISLLPSIDNSSFIIASVTFLGSFALIFRMSWVIWRNKVSLPSTFYELPV